ncbi:MAG: bifunctional glutamate N-acetyltransferase/amino-acid acetyltransferase ArgJ [Alphaproteobacteria bacterium]|nr:bifunctional glutamate N-acetyltransferase/amino-acid acetyltransferase ArgJ [Alphaproteobacteria bacterium]
MIARSPLAPDSLPELPVIAGVEFAAVRVGIKPSGTKKDVMLAVFAPNTTVAGVFTRSLTASAPVEWCRANAARGAARALVVNSGNSNAFTGKLGVASVERTVIKAAEICGCKPEEIFVASTGVIGEPLNDAKITAALGALHDSRAPGDWAGAMEAILTTDTFPKAAVRETEINGTKVRLAGIAKGSGMIAPDMATMLAFLFTDAAISAVALQAMLADANEKTFNCITVDSDTSTSDTLMLFATGKAGNVPPKDAADPSLAAFRKALYEVLRELSHLVVKDGEGASKFIEITVTGAEDDKAARIIALAIANSPLVKTAIAGEDANWGRVVMAVGKAGQKANRDKLSIWIGDAHVAMDGQVHPEYQEGPTAAYMKGKNIVIRADVGIASGSATVWTCDLTHGYISINADYRS